MEINGKVLQIELLRGLEERIKILTEKGITPGIAIVTLGPEESWEAYVGQKIKLAKQLQIEAKLINLNPSKTEDVLSVIDGLNSNLSIHGLIVQRPFPTYIDTERVIQSVSKKKDIDGFRKDSKFEVPVWLAVEYFIKHMGHLLVGSENQKWLSNQSILVVGHGETAGQPVINGLKKIGIEPVVIDSKTRDTSRYYEDADIIILATGKRIEVPFKKLKKNCILIGIGLHREQGKLQGDFDDFEASNHVLYYTPSPGGVGPLNLYFLFENLIKACEEGTH